jgi:hypothetical protein
VVLRCISVLACLAFAAPSAAQEPTNVIVFLKSPYYAEVDQSVARSTAEEHIDSSWCQPGANLVAFPWGEELATVGRGNTPVALVHAILADPGGICEYFVVYVSIYAVPVGLGKKLAGWQPTLSRPSDNRSTAAILVKPQPLAAAPATAAALAPAAAPALQSEEQGLREAESPPLPRSKPQPPAVRRIAAPPTPKIPAPGRRPALPPGAP